MFKTIDRYILREILLPSLLALVVLTFLLELPIVLKSAEALIAKGVAWSTIARAMLMLLPSQLSLAIPMSVLLGILIGLGRLSADREFVALQACGVSLVRLLRPLFLFAAVATGLAAYETIVALPASNQAYRELALNEEASRVERNVTPGVFFEDFGNLIIYVRELPPEGGWRDVYLADTTQPGKVTVYLAKRGRIRLDRGRRLVLLELLDGTTHTMLVDQPEKSNEDSFQSLVIALDPNRVFPAPPAKGAPEMTIAELHTRIDAAEARGDRADDFRFMIQQKLSLPATCPILALIGLALGASNRKDGKLASFVYGFAVIFVYYVLLYIFRALAQGGWFSPEWAPWVPNIVMMVAGVVMLFRRDRSADQPIRLSLPAFWRRSAPTSTAPNPATAVAARHVRLVVRLPHFDLPVPKILDWYVARQYWRIFGLSVLSLLGIFYISNFIDVADELFRKDATLGVVVRYFYFQTPLFVFYVIPIGVLIATLVTVALMTKNSELIVMRACGISLYRTAAPLVLFGILAAGTLFFMQERILPAANQEADRLNRIVRGFPPRTSPFNQRWIIGRNGSFYHYDLFDSTGNRFLNLWTYSLAKADWRLVEVTFANDAALVPTRNDAHPDFSKWIARRGWTRQFYGVPKTGGKLLVKYDPFTEREITLESPEYFSSRPSETEQMTFDQMLTYSELRSYIDQLKARGDPVVSYTVSLRRKIAFPLVTVIMTLLAVPLAASGGRRGALYGIGVAIVLALGYLVTNAIFGALGTGGFLSPMLAAWAPSLLFGAGAAYMILTVRT